MSQIPLVLNSDGTPPRRTSPAQRGFLIITAVLLVGWLGWLSYTALTKSRAPTVSRAQAAGASVFIVAEVTAADPNRESLLRRSTGIGGQNLTVLKGQSDKPGFLVTVKDRLSPKGAVAGDEIGVSNLPSCAGYTGPGEYLLLLNRDGEATIDGKPAYIVVGQQRSPGADLDGVGPPMIYPWTNKTGGDLRKQVERVLPRD